MAYDYFHLKCQMMRKGSDYGIKRETFSNNWHMMLTRSEAQCIFIGSSPKSQIQLANTAPQHVSLLLSKDMVALEALAPFELSFKEETKVLNQGQTEHIPLVNRAKWDILFPNQTSVKFKLYDEMFLIQSDVQKRLEKEYGTLQKIWESHTFLVFKTHDNKVIKLLQPSYAQDEKTAKRFEKAAMRFQELPSNLFLKINKVVCDHAMYFTEMEYLEGDTLGNYLAQRGVLPLAEAENIVRQIAQRLAVLQDHGYSVRNLNPENILMCKDGTIRITGFLLLKDHSLHMTQEDEQMIIPNYSSPEQLQDPSLVDVYSDIFSLGAIFYSLLMGEPPFNASNINHYLVMLSSADPITVKKIDDLRQDIPIHIAKLITSMLSFDKGHRPAPRQIITSLGTEVSEIPEINIGQGEQSFLKRIVGIFKRRT